MSNEVDRLKSAYEEHLRKIQAAIDLRQRELAVLAEVAARVHGVAEEQEVLGIALDEIVSRMGLSAAWIFTGDRRERKLHLAASRGVAPQYLDEVRREGLGECLCPEVFWTGHRMQARNTVQCPRMPDIVAGLATPVAHACIPLKFEGATTGVLNVAARPGELFSDDELRFLETLAHQVSLAVERARQRRDQRRRDEEARALAAVTRAIGGALDAGAVLRAVGQTGREVLGADRAAILLGAEPEAMSVAHLAGRPHPELVEGQRVDLVAAGARVPVLALRERRGYSVDDPRFDPRVNEELARRWEAQSGIFAPLLAGDRVLGLLMLTRRQPSHWGGDQVSVTEALAAQAAVALENVRLYEEARQAYRELKEAQQRIIRTEKMAVLGTFASGLAHEVRNPLNSIGLQLSILERRCVRLGPRAEKQVAEVLAVIRDEVRRLDELVGDFLLFARADRVEHRPAELHSLIEEVLKLLRPEARKSGVTLRHETVGDPVAELRMDAEKIKQVVINLVRNAIEAMPRGGAVRVESGRAEGQVRLAVRDDGPGLPRDIDVFQLFVTTKPQGTGLGLSIVQQIVLQHGGDILAEDVPGGGTRFVIHLPATDASAPEEGAGT